jgi:deoxyhypusine synthase
MTKKKAFELLGLEPTVNRRCIVQTRYSELVKIYNPTNVDGEGFPLMKRLIKLMIPY